MIKRRYFIKLTCAGGNHRYRVFNTVSFFSNATRALKEEIKLFADHHHIDESLVSVDAFNKI